MMKSLWDFGLGRSLPFAAIYRLVVGHLVHEAGQIRAQRLGSTPTVLHLSAQGCRVGAATLGYRSKKFPTPTGLHPIAHPPPASERPRVQPFQGCDLFVTRTQGSS